jgi:hypothetical protein
MVSNRLLLFMAALAVLVVGVLVVSLALVFGVLAPVRTTAFATIVVEPTVAEATFMPPSPTPTVTQPTEFVPGATPLPAGLTPEVVLPTATQILPTAAPTLPPAPGFTSTPQSPAGPAASCDQAQFVRDITIPGGMKVPAGGQFTKTWLVKNTGTCTWTSDYDLVFSQGNQLSGTQTNALPGGVKPGDSIELSLALTAPAKDGEYTGSWKLRNGSGQVFGFGTGGTDSLWARIKVAKFETVYSLLDNFCDALWRNKEVRLACPGDEEAEMGYVIQVAEPVLENGTTENEAALVLSPETVPDGLIVGHFPAFKVKAGDRFRTVIGCMAGASGCDVTYRLSYQIGGGGVVRLAEWKEKYDGKIQKLDVDLSALDGQKVELILSVRVEKNPPDARVFLLEPRIVR